MTDEPVLTSSWCTNWAGFNTPRLWAMLSDEDNPDAWRQVTAWAEVAVAVQEQRARLVQARGSLTAVWPPEQNGAAQAFVTELDSLISRMDSAQQDAGTTATGRPTSWTRCAPRKPRSSRSTSSTGTRATT